MNNLIKILILFTLLSCSNSSIKLANNVLIVAKDNDGLYYWDDNKKLIKIFDKVFDNQIFLEQPFKKINSHTLIVKVLGISPNKSNTSIKWTEYKINIKNNTCVKLAEHIYSNEPKNEYIIKTSEKRTIRNDTIILFNYIDNIHGYSVSTSLRNVESLNKHKAYYKNKGIFIEINGIAKNIHSYKGYFDTKTGNGTFSLDISDDGNFVIIPILKTNLLQWITNNGSGKVLIYDSNKGEITETIKKRMIRPKISTDNRLIAYVDYGKNINIFNLSRKLNYKSDSLTGDAYIWLNKE